MYSCALLFPVIINNEKSHFAAHLRSHALIKIDQVSRGNWESNCNLPTMRCRLFLSHPPKGDQYLTGCVIRKRILRTLVRKTPPDQYQTLFFYVFTTIQPTLLAYYFRGQRSTEQARIRVRDVIEDTEVRRNITRLVERVA